MVALQGHNVCKIWWRYQWVINWYALLSTFYWFKLQNELMWRCVHLGAHKHKKCHYFTHVWNLTFTLKCVGVKSCHCGRQFTVWPQVSKQACHGEREAACQTAACFQKDQWARLQPKSLLSLPSSKPTFSGRPSQWPMKTLTARVSEIRRSRRTISQR